ncbi:MAG TPA: hypothetical protein VFC39_17970, partial [Acidobacteriaceae bacterium]|nr:hypothetical protein [Acidobacteriaceae bacterium]
TFSGLLSAAMALCFLLIFFMAGLLLHPRVRIESLASGEASRLIPSEARSIMQQATNHVFFCKNDLSPLTTLFPTNKNFRDV